MDGERFTVPVAVHLLLFDGDRVLLSLRTNTGYEDGRWGVPAGHLDGGESVTAAAIREAREELSIALDSDALTIVGVMHSRQPDEYVDWFVTVSRWSGTIANAEPHKCKCLRWFRVDELPVDMVAYVRRGIENARAGIAFDSVGFPPA